MLNQPFLNNTPYTTKVKRDDIIRKLQHVYDICNKHWQQLDPESSKKLRDEAWDDKSTTFDLYYFVSSKNKSLSTEGVVYLNELFKKFEQRNVPRPVIYKIPSCVYCKYHEVDQPMFWNPFRGFLYHITKNKTWLYDTHAIEFAKCIHRDNRAHYHASTCRKYNCDGDWFEGIPPKKPNSILRLLRVVKTSIVKIFV